MSDLGRAFVDALSDDDLEHLVQRLGPRLLERLGPQVAGGDEDRWLSTRDAATYLGLTSNALHKLTAARAIPFEQETAGGKCWFKRSELDVWRRGGSAFHHASTRS